MEARSNMWQNQIGTSMPSRVAHQTVVISLDVRLHVKMLYSSLSTNWLNKSVLSSSDSKRGSLTVNISFALIKDIAFAKNGTIYLENGP